mmetsp:Transcript_31056/g.48412  ORF Transcript_31056/g.48412 Transcript_31056/m.48412 type:complete len:387 (-) Transcript_31056:60-1220(-)
MSDQSFAQKKPEASGSFDGIFTLRSREDAEELSDAVRGIIDASVDLFFTIDTDPHVKKDMEEDLATMKRLLAQFPEMCLKEETKKSAQSVVGGINEAADDILQVFQVHSPGTKLEPAHENKVRSALQKIMFQLIAVTDLMEDLQRARCLILVSNAFRHLQIFRDTTSDYRLNEKLSAYVRDMKTLLNVLRERRDVLGGGPEADQLEQVTGQMEGVIPALTRAVQAFVAEPSQPNSNARDEHIRAQARCFQVIMSSLNTYQASGSFDYTSLAEAMDALEKAIQAGDRDAATSKAKDIADTLRNKPDFGVDRLNDLLRQMVQLTKDGLEKPGENQDELGNVLNGMKTQVLCVQKKGKSSNQAARMDTLLQCAQSLSTGIQELEGSLQA